MPDRVVEGGFVPTPRDRCLRRNVAVRHPDAMSEPCLTSRRSSPRVENSVLRRHLPGAAPV